MARYGAAAWRGLQSIQSGVEWVLFSSADGSDRLTPQEVQEWQENVEVGFQMVLGDRFAPLASRQHLKTIQSFGNRLCCWLIAVGWPRYFNDMGSLRLVQVTALRRLDLHDQGCGWNVEMQVRRIEHGLHIAELPVGFFAASIRRSRTG